MAFIIKIVSLSLVFILLVVFRKKIAELLKKLPLPEFLSYVLVSIPLIIFEEQINCQPQWCGTVIIPPTLPFVLAEVVILYVVVKWLKPKRAWMSLLGYALFGVCWELTIGGARGALLSGPFLVFIVIWIAISYVFVSLTPLSIVSTERTKNQ